MKKRFIVEVEVDEKKVDKLYPNYCFNYGCPEELIESIMEHFIYDADTDMSKDGLKTWGYAKRVIKEIK